MIRLSVLLLFVLGLAGCGPDPAELAQCRRILAAFEDAPDTVEILERAADPDRSHGVVLHYRTADAPEDRHWLACRFEARRLEGSPPEPVWVATDREGELSAMQLFFLRRWLTLERPLPMLRPVEPAEGAKEPPVAEPVRDFAFYLVQQGVNAAVLACVYGLLAVGYSLVYGILGRINFAFGELFMVGAWHTVLGSTLFALMGAYGVAVLPLVLLGTVVATAVQGWAMERLVFRPLRATPTQVPLIAAIGLSIFLQELVRLLQGARDRWLPPVFGEPFRLAEGGAFTVHVSAGQIVILVFTAAAAGGLLALLRRSRFGRAHRACADDMRMAALLGVDVDRTIGRTFALGAACAGAAGLIVATYYGGVNFFMGYLIGFKALAAAVVGGVGSVPGAFLGGVLIAVLETGWAALFSLGYKDIAVFGALILFLILRPTGILGVDRTRGD
jgi:branched-chain amino acid transport system permease protein